MLQCHEWQQHFVVISRAKRKTRRQSIHTPLCDFFSKSNGSVSLHHRIHFSSPSDDPRGLVAKATSFVNRPRSCHVILVEIYHKGRTKQCLFTYEYCTLATAGGWCRCGECGSEKHAQISPTSKHVCASKSAMFKYAMSTGSCTNGNADIHGMPRKGNHLCMSCGAEHGRPCHYQANSLGSKNPSTYQGTVSL